MTFKDHFSTVSADYAAYRPGYPLALVDVLADLSEAHYVALDVGCGSGQLSVLLTERFQQVIATDASAQQIAAAVPHARVDYRVATAERTGVADRSVDLITVAQAAHWFDLPAFYREVRRVGKPGAVFALISYGVLDSDADVDPVIQHFYKDVLGPYWPPERSHVDDGYRSFDFPFADIAMPPLAIEVNWRADELVGYVDTWSASRNAEKELGRAPIEAFVRDLNAVWGGADRRRVIRFPLGCRVTRL